MQLPRPTSNRSTFIWVTTIVILGVVLLTFSSAPAAPTINWTPSSLNVEVARGYSKAIPVSFISSEAINNVTLRVVPKLAPFLQVNPSNFSSIAKNQLINLNVVFSAASNSAVGIFDGTLQIRIGKTLAKPLPIKLLVTVVPLPPDPGEAGKATLAGIDSDGDGVRDDVQRYIALTHPESEKTRAALSHYTLTTQESLLDANDEQLSISHAINLLRATECLYYTRPDGAKTIVARLLAQILNTEARSRTWIAAEKHLSGEIFRSLSDPKSACSFDPDSMGD